ncbi:uncharacterized protein LOC142640143 [Castanea sativa]|uniref:uncharacterized protein LOC142640143 n=1 Tax=Castanea sativa TaxID=21020 RepID=UPI003F650841
MNYLTESAYCDIICYETQLFALKDNGTVEVWDFDLPTLFPTNIMSFRPVIIDFDGKEFPSDKFSTQCYLAESMGDLLLVNRLIGNFVNSEGFAVDESDLGIEDTQPLVCPYRTKGLHVYKLVSIRNTWEIVESLGNVVIFWVKITLCHCPLRIFKGVNPIYYTDDNWDQMNEDYLYGGHDCGVFNLTDGSSKT